MRHHHRRFLQASLVSGFFLVVLLFYFTGLFNQPKKMFENFWLPSVEPMVSYGKISDFFTGVEVVGGDSININETIDVNFDVAQQEFVRVIPFRYQLGGGNFKLGIRNIKSDIANGEAEVRVKRDHGNYYISIKRKDGSDFTGLNVINLSYQMTRTINYLDNNDQLVYMVTGYQWPVEIERARAVIALPDLADGQLSANCYIGQANQQIDNCQVSSVKSDSVGFDSLKSIKPGQGMVVSFIWPKGMITAPSVIKQWWWILRDNPILLLPFIALLLMYINWSILGRDKWWRANKKSSLPPSDLTPTEIGTIYDNRANVKDLLLIILDVARRGYLVIRKDDGFWIINKTKDWKNLDILEKKFLQLMFDGKDWWRSDDDDCQRSLKDAIKIGTRETYTRLTDKGYFSVSPHATRMTYLILALMFWLGGALFIPWYGGGFSALAIFLVGLIIFWFGYYMPIKSPLGMSALRDVVSYRQYFKSEYKEISENDWLNHLIYVLLFHLDGLFVKSLKNKEVVELRWFVFPYNNQLSAKVLLKNLRKFENDLVKIKHW